jgi:hypothetical protein
MASTPATSGPSWRVVGQVQQWGKLPNGQSGQGVMVTYQLDSGSQGTVFVPLTSYNTQNVKDAINAAAAHVAAVDGLASD